MALMGALLALGSVCPVASAAADLLIIANESVPVDTVTPHRLARIFLLEETRWPNGQPIVPVNREATSRTRQWFTRIVLNSSVRALTSYWNRMQFQGHMPPVVQESDRAVLGFVAHVPGAIGYIQDRGMSLPPGVRVVDRISTAEKDASPERRPSLHSDSRLWRNSSGMVVTDGYGNGRTGR